MRVTVLFFGVLKDIVGRAEESLDVEPGSSLERLFQLYAERFATLRDKRSSILLARNREFSAADTILTENDEVAFLPPVSGGSETAVDKGDGHYFAVIRERIDSQALAKALKRDEDGAVVIFEGVVRNNTRGRPTSYLEYECYEQMAIGQMKRIGLSIARQFDIGRIGMVHRLGRLAVGEASVAVVTTAPHRRPAFEAALEGINRLKREVPIWKKEFFSDGEVWVEGEWDSSLLGNTIRHEAP